MQYIRFSEGKTKNQLIPVSDSPWKYIKNPNADHYISMMKYSHEQFLEYKKKNSLAGMTGSTTTRIWADFDKKAGTTDLRPAFQDAKEFVKRLKKLGFADEEIQLSFSGNKGIAIIVEVSQELKIEQVEAFVSNLAKGLETFDTSMYDHQRIFRLLFTKNEKSGLYKIPLQVEELDTDPETIKENAKTNFSPEDQENVKTFYKRSMVKLPDNLLKVEVKPVKEKKLTNKTSDNKPRHWKEYKWQILQGNFEKGERHSALMVLAATCRGLGYDADSATALCLTADAKHCLRTKDVPVSDLEDNIIPSIYSDTWNGGQFSPEKNKWLRDYCERLGINVSGEEKSEFEIIKIGDLKDGFIEYIKTIDENTVKTGIDCLDEAMPLTTGMICGVVGAASSGKTALALKMLKNTSQNNVLSVFASLDMHRTRLFHKLAMTQTDMTREQLNAAIQNGTHIDAFDKIAELYKNVHFYDRSAASVPEIRRYVEAVQEQQGKKVKFLMIDYFERLGSERSDDTAASKEIAGALQDLCNDLNLCIVVLVQPNKFSLGGGPDSPILSYTAIKGSSFLYQSFRSIISIWRPFFTPDTKSNDKFMEMAILKNDLGELDHFKFGWSGRKGDIWELGPEEMSELDELLKEKKQRKDGEKQEIWG